MVLCVILRDMFIILNYVRYKELVICDDDNMLEFMGNVKSFKVDKDTVKFIVRHFGGKIDSFCQR